MICIVKIIVISGRANKTNDSVCKGNNLPPKSLIVTVTSHQVVRKTVEVVVLGLREGFLIHHCALYIEYFSFVSLFSDYFVYM